MYIEATLRGADTHEWNLEICKLFKVLKKTLILHMIINRNEVVLPMKGLESKYYGTIKSER